ncbi:MAG: 8-amino-7-oxononanoate synthase [Chloroflexi bacterium]|nr:8-amino-7-oxononanoate synthase [Chloroflexota bacterium]
MSSTGNTFQLGFLSQELDRLKGEGLYRSCYLIEGEQLPRVNMGGRPTIMLSSNNYLGLATHPKLKEAAKQAIDLFGSGASGSRLISGNMELHERLEARIAQFKGAEAALVFNSGYTANLGLISSLARAGDVVFSDELNHASIVDGCRLSKAQIKIYPHKDVATLEALLASATDVRRKLVVTDGVFSMDGDIAPLPDITVLARKYGAVVMVDDAHGTGVIGPDGRGVPSLFGLEDAVDIQMGTLSKAIGCFGAYVAGGRDLKEFLVNQCRPFIFTTALPPSVIASALVALDLLDEEPWRREDLNANADFLSEGLRRLGYDVPSRETQIIPVLIGDSGLTIRLSQELLRRGVFACGIRPPTVPEGKSRLRVTVMATHTRDDLEDALEAFAAAGKELGIIG